MRFLENFCVQEFPSQQDLIKNADFEKECFAAFLKYKACTPEGTHMMKVVSVVFVRDFVFNGRITDIFYLKNYDRHLPIFVWHLL